MAGIAMVGSRNILLRVYTLERKGHKAPEDAPQGVRRRAMSLRERAVVPNVIAAANRVPCLCGGV